MPNSYVDGFVCSLHVVNGGDIPLVEANISYAVDGLNKAVLKAAVGNWEINSLPNDITLTRGATAWVTISYPGQGSVRIFTGVLFDYAPSTSLSGGNGQMSLEIILYGRLYHLTTGTLHSSMTTPQAYLDSAGYWSTARRSTGPVTRPATMNPAVALGNFGVAYLNMLSEIASSAYAPTDSVSEFIKKVFGDNINGPALNVLNDIESFLVFDNFGQGKRKAIITGICSKIDELTTGDWGVNSFMKRIEELGVLLYFSAVEDGSTVRLVPFSPFFRTNQAFKVIPETYYNITSGQSPDGIAINYQGAVLTTATGAALSGSSAPVAGYYRSADAAKIGGQVFTTPMPSIFVMSTSVTTDVADAAVNGPRAFVDVTPDLGAGIAKYKYWEQRFRNRVYYVGCPYLRLDIAPLTPVCIVTPSSDEIQSTIGATSIYGLVTRVSIHLDSTQGVADTQIEVGYARNQVDQQRLIDREASHPIWSGNWTGSTLYGNRH
jgi:hypothetical protein